MSSFIFSSPLSSTLHQSSLTLFEKWPKGSFIFGGVSPDGYIQSTGNVPEILQQKASGSHAATHTSTLPHASHPRAGSYWDLLCLLSSIHFSQIHFKDSDFVDTHISHPRPLPDAIYHLSPHKAKEFSSRIRFKERAMWRLQGQIPPLYIAREH